MAYQSEIEKLEQRFRDKPEQWFAALADTYRKNGDLELALEILLTWIEKRPTYTSGYIVQGRCYLDKGEDDKASETFQKVLGLDPENIIALRSLADIAKRGGDTESARIWFTQLLEVDPMNEEAQDALEELEGQLSAAAEAAVEPEAAQPPPPPSVSESATVDMTAEPPPVPDTEPVGLEATPEFSASVEDVAEVEPAGLADPSPGEIGDSAPVAGLEATVVEEPSGFEATVAETPAYDEPIAEDAGTEEPAAHDEEAIVIGAPSDDSSAAVVDDPPAVDPASEIEAGIDRYEEEESGPIVIGGAETINVAGEPMESATDDLDLGFDVPETVGDVPDPSVDVEQPATVETSAEDTVAEPFRPITEPISLAPETVEPVMPQVEPEPQESVAESVPQIVEPIAAADQSLDLIMPDDVTPEPPEPVVTATMADLHVRQGLYDQARDIYGQLLEQDPSNAELAEKLAALEGKSDTPAKAVPSASVPSQRFSVAITGGESARDMLLSIAGASSANRVVRPKPRVQQPAMPGSAAEAGSTASFDQFFGNPAGPEPAAKADKADAESPPLPPGHGEDKAFQSWLKDLKT